MDDEVAREEVAIGEVADVVRIARQFPRWWFRGHDSRLPDDTEPQPRVFRAELEERFQKPLIQKARFPESDRSWKSVPDTERRFWYEPEIAADFASQAPAVYPNYREECDDLSWLFLMQHFGAPTRLLDWTTSILVALFFAIGAEGAEDEEVGDLSDGEIWAFDAVEFTKTWRQANDGKSVSEEAIRLANQARMDARFRVRKSLRDSDCSTMPIAMWGPLKFSRLAAQHSRFTIHPRPLSGEKWPQQNRRRFTVGGGSKRELRRELAQLGFTRFTLFQDLDTLGQTVVQEMLLRYSSGCA